MLPANSRSITRKQGRVIPPLFLDSWLNFRISQGICRPGQNRLSQPDALATRARSQPPGGSQPILTPRREWVCCALPIPIWPDPFYPHRIPEAVSTLMQEPAPIVGTSPIRKEGPA